MNESELDDLALELATKCIIEESTGSGTGWKWGVFDVLELLNTTESMRLSKKFKHQLENKSILPKI